MHKVFSIQKAFTGLSRMIHFPKSTLAQQAYPSQESHHLSHPLSLFSSLIKVMPLKADLLEPL